MSVSSEVKRTLVKSPPELWAELSDPTALSRHLGELGEIHIVRTEPEQAVDWEAPQVSGTVRIEPSGWGTKVTLTAIRSLEPAAPSSQGEHLEDLEAELEEIEEIEVDETHIDPATEAGALLNVDGGSHVEPHPRSYPEYDPRPASECDPEPPAECDPELEPRRGFFARLFRRRPKIQPLPEEPIEPEPLPVVPEPAMAAEPVAEREPVLAVEPVLPAEPELSSELEPDESASEQTDIAVELAQLEEQTTAVLVAVLDRLGAAHHRPFSRA
jgi:hypothetical protein